MPAIHSLRTSINAKWSVTAILVATLLAGSLVAQTNPRPSERYEPIRQSVYDQAQVPERSDGLMVAQRLPAYDQEAIAPSIAEASRPESNTGLVQQASFQDGNPPAILTGNAGTNLPIQEPQPKVTPLPPMRPSGNTRLPNGLLPRKNPGDFAGAMQMDANRGPLSDPNNASSFPNNPARPAAAENTLMPQSQARVPVDVTPQADTSASPMVDPGLRSSAIQTAAGRMTEENQQAQAMARQAGGAMPEMDSSAISATQFVADINQEKQEQANRRGPQTTGSNGATPDQAFGGNVSPAMQLNGQENRQAVAIRDQQVRPVVSTTPEVEPATLKLSAPAIEVLTEGPETIGINKPSQYKIMIRNNGTIAADRIIVDIDFPEWIDLENISMTSGAKAMTNEKEKPRLSWTVDQITGASAQTMTITAIPRKAEVFDVGVQWSLVPRMGKTAVRVTEPKLEMTISGPQEVLYGETALYHVTVRNPGTGEAENVTIMLPEALGGERASLGSIPPGKEQNLQVELLARTAGDLNLVTTATAEGNLKTSAERELKVRRANLEVNMTGPPMKYSGGVGEYQITIKNSGDATATEIETAVALPSGVKYLKGIEAVKLIEGGMRWPVGALAPGQSRTFRMFCQLDTSGDLQLEVGTRGKGDLAASGACQTRVETIADLVLTVTDPKGPLPTGEEVPYTIKIRNRGTKSAKNVDLIMLFSEGIEPRSAKGIQHSIVPGQVKFSPIPEIAPGQEIAFEVAAEAIRSGSHIFRAQLNCEESGSREMAEGTTRFFGDEIPSTASAAPGEDNEEAFDNSFRR